jgi:hypothetical protein
MTRDDHTPRYGEALTDWINRVRPKAAPEIADQPVFTADGLAWTTEGWMVTTEIDETGQPSAHWHTPDGHHVTGYALHVDGRRTAAVNVDDGDSEWRKGWPVAA